MTPTISNWPFERWIYFIKMIKARHCTEEDLTDENVDLIFTLINSVYDQAEEGMWQFHGTRASLSDVRTMLSEQSLILAEKNGEIVGSTKIGRHDDICAEFGMLVADPNLRGSGIGTALVSAAEHWAREGGHKVMRLELLTPRHWSHPSKEFLKKWYSRLGYIPGETVAFNKAEHLATECDFTVWKKQLE